MKKISEKNSSTIPRNFVAIETQCKLRRHSRRANADYNLELWCQNNGEFGSLLIKQWTGKKPDGSEVKMSELTPFSDTRVFWSCNECGNEWVAPIMRRTKGESSCAVCSNVARGKHLRERSLQNSSTLAQWCESNPKRGDILKKEWVGSLEDDTPVTMDEVTYACDTKVRWKCSKGHTWVTRINCRTSSGANCPTCGNISLGESLKKPVSERLLSVWCENNGDRGRKLLNEWALRNPDGSPSGMNDITYGSNSKVLWRCNNGHEWEAPPSSRTLKNADCPYCNGARVKYEDSLAFWCETNGERGEQLKKEWLGIKRGSSRTVSMKSCSIAYGSRTYLWKCTQGHTWYAGIPSRIHGNDCPECKRLRKSKEV